MLEMLADKAGWEVLVLASRCLAEIKWHTRIEYERMVKQAADEHIYLRSQIGFP